MESMMSLWVSILAHSNVIMHATAWLESGLATSYEKIILDADMIGAMRAWLSPLDLSDDALAFETAFHASMVSDLRPFGTWEADGDRAGEHAVESASRNIPGATHGSRHTRGS